MQFIVNKHSVHSVGIENLHNRLTINNESLIGLGCEKKIGVIVSSDFRVRKQSKKAKKGK